MSNWAFPNIPKRLLLYWGKNQPMSWLRYQTVETFRKLNPDWEILICYPTESVTRKPWDTGEHRLDYHRRDYWEELLARKDVQFKAIEWEGAAAELSEVHRSDLLRYWLLGNIGGVWADFDIAFLRPMDTLCAGPKMPASLHAAVCHGSPHWSNQTWHSVGFLMGAKDTPFWMDVLKEAEAKVKAGVRDYQELGRVLLDSLYPDAMPEGVGNIPFDWVYGASQKVILDTFFRVNGKLALARPHPDAIGIHWFGGSAMAASIQRGDWEYPLKRMINAL